jgi:hypothetical protein
MPRFGVQSLATFHEYPASRFALAFEEGYRQLPWVESVNGRGESLSKLIVTFVYSKSGGGAIHSVSSQSKYFTIDEKTNSGNLFQAEYIWIEEEAVDIHAGASIMFLATLVASIVLLFNSCGDTNGNLSSTSKSHDDAVVDDGSYSGYTDQASAVSFPAQPKWE